VSVARTPWSALALMGLCSKQFQKILAKQGIKFKLGTKVLSADKVDGKVLVKTRSAKGDKEETVSRGPISWVESNLVYRSSKPTSFWFRSVVVHIRRALTLRLLVSRKTTRVALSSMTSSVPRSRTSSVSVT
jgi:hypothetical protein